MKITKNSEHRAMWTVYAKAKLAGESYVTHNPGYNFAVKSAVTVNGDDVNIVAIYDRYWKRLGWLADGDADAPQV